MVVSKFTLLIAGLAIVSSVDGVLSRGQGVDGARRRRRDAFSYDEQTGAFIIGNPNGLYNSGGARLRGNNDVSAASYGGAGADMSFVAGGSRRSTGSNGHRRSRSGDRKSRGSRSKLKKDGSKIPKSRSIDGHANTRGLATDTYDGHVAPRSPKKRRRRSSAEEQQSTSAEVVQPKISISSEIVRNPQSQVTQPIQTANEGEANKLVASTGNYITMTQHHALFTLLLQGAWELCKGSANANVLFMRFLLVLTVSQIVTTMVSNACIGGPNVQIEEISNSSENGTGAPRDTRVGDGPTMARRTAKIMDDGGSNARKDAETGEGEFSTSNTRSVPARPRLKLSAENAPAAGSNLSQQNALIDEAPPQHGCICAMTSCFGRADCRCKCPCLRPTQRPLNRSDLLAADPTVKTPNGSQTDVMEAWRSCALNHTKSLCGPPTPTTRERRSKALETGTPAMEINPETGKKVAVWLVADKRVQRKPTQTRPRPAISEKFKCLKRLIPCNLRRRAASTSRSAENITPSDLTNGGSATDAERLS